MFQTGLSTTVRGFTAKEGLSKYAPDGKLITEIALGVGDGSVRFPTTWVIVPVWEELAEQAVEVIDKKGICVEASGMLQIRMYEGKGGRAVAVELKNVRALRIYDRDGELVKVLSGKESGIKTEV